MDAAWRQLLEGAPRRRGQPREAGLWLGADQAPLGAVFAPQGPTWPAPPPGATALLLLLEPTPAQLAHVPASLPLWVASARVEEPVDAAALGRPCQRPAPAWIAEATVLNEAWRHVQRTGRVFTQLKVASSLDGRIATREGQSKWITQPTARAAGRALRAELDGICVGVNTVLADDPQLNCRSPGTQDPVRVILDSQLRTPPTAQVIQTARSQPTWLLSVGAVCVERQAALERAGARVLTTPPTPEGRVNLEAALELLAEEGLCSLLVEGGGEVHGGFLDAGLVDKLSWFIAPLLIGGQAARPAVAGQGAAQLAQATRLEGAQLRAVGDDWLLEAYPRRPLDPAPEARAPSSL